MWLMLAGRHAVLALPRCSPVPAAAEHRRLCPGLACVTPLCRAVSVVISELADVQGASELADALGQLDIGSPAVAPTWENGRPILRGMPQMATRPRHTRFTDEGSAVDSPGTGIMSLRGVPAALGTHIRFDNDV